MKKILLSILICSLFFLTQAWAKHYIPKADNFIFLVDHSGSMSKKNNEGQKKVALAKEVLTLINQNLPPLEANFALYTFAPFQEYLPLSPYNQARLQEKINQISEDIPLFGRFTPIGDGLAKLDETKLKNTAGTTRVIVITDGGQNSGQEPLPVLQNIYDNYTNRVCFHFIGVEKNSPQVKTLQQLTDLNPCSTLIFADELTNQNNLNNYLQRVFYTSQETKPAQPAQTTPQVSPKPISKPKPVIAPAPKKVEKKPVKVEQVIVFRSVNFDFDSAKIKPQAKAILEEAAIILQKYPERKIIVEGHTCNMGPAKYNQKLSEKRAQSVASFLIQQGVNKNRIKTIGYGESKPKFDNKTLQGRRLNRRVEIRLAE
ncbi:MAG: OmpA-OmpF porin, family [Desulfonauticus sp.]|jgi:OOP family OmpA-OmpF porin|nr:OmpA-OmpF porin, family [Desulfonauticus sp.]